MATSVFAARSSLKAGLFMALAIFLTTATRQARAQSGEDPSLFDLPGLWKDQDDKAFVWRRAKEGTTLVALVYTSCQMSCPLITQELLAIQGKLSEVERSHVRIRLFSFDPARDTVARLKEFAIERKLDTNHWTLLTGTEDGARELAVALGAQFKKLQNGEFSHSNTVTVLAPNGAVLHQQAELGVGRDATLMAIRKSLADATIRALKQ